MHDLLERHDPARDAYALDHRAGPATTAADAATAASRRLDAAFRIYLAEQGTKLVHRDELAALVGGASRLLLTANSLATLPLRARGATASDQTFLDGELHELQSAIERIADDLAPEHGLRAQLNAGRSLAGQALAATTSSLSRTSSASGPAAPVQAVAAPVVTPEVLAQASPVAVLSAVSPQSVCARWIHHHLSHLQATVDPLSVASAVLREAHGPLAR